MDEARTRLLVGIPPGQVAATPGLSGRAARALAVAAAAGAPGVPALDAAIDARAHLDWRTRALDVATAQARAVAVSLGALPVLAVPGLGALLGMPLWRFYLTPAGWVVGAVGVGLIVTGILVAGRLVSRVGRPPRAGSLAWLPLAVALVGGLLVGPLLSLVAALVAALALRRRMIPEPVAPDADEVADLVATGLAGGLPPGAALRAAAGQLPVHRAALERAALALELGLDAEPEPGLARILDALRAASRWGAPAAPALRRIATDLRDAEQARVLAATERLPALLAFPTALCLLPACVVLVGAPLLAAGLAAAGT